MQLEIVTPDRRVAISETSDVIIPGLAGEFEVGPGHEPYLALIGTGILTFKSGSSLVKLMVQGGFAEIDADKVTLMCERASLKEEVMNDEENRQLEQALVKLRDLGTVAPDDETFELIKAEVDRATAKIALAKL